MAENKYPEDEFDLLAAERSIRGVHRPRESNRVWWIALVAVLVFAPLTGWGVVHFLGDSGSSSATKSPSASVSATTATPVIDPTTEEPATPEPTEEPSEEPTTEAPEPEPVAIEHGKAVSVLNASSVTGLANKKKAILQSAGFTAVTTGNYRHQRPAASQVFYADEAAKPTAQAVADSLGISAGNMIMNANATGGDKIIVVLAGEK